MAWVYVLHFNEPYPGGRRPQHYVGVAANLEHRLREHRSGNPGKGGCLTRALRAAGMGFLVATAREYATPDEAFREERRIKARRRHYQLCPICKEKS